MNTPMLFETVSRPPMAKQPKLGPYYEQAKAIRQRRQELRLSQVNVAEIYGTTQGYISDTERGWTNFAGADLEWYRRMGAALQWDVRTLMNKLGIQVVIAEHGTENGETSERPASEGPDISLGGYAVVVIEITDVGPSGVFVLQKSVVVPEYVASLSPIKGLVVDGNYLNAAAYGMVAVYADVEPTRDDVVVIEIAGRQHLAYYTESGFVFTDRSIRPRMPQEFEPDRILGVVQVLVTPAPPRRTSSNLQ